MSRLLAAPLRHHNIQYPTPGTQHRHAVPYPASGRPAWGYAGVTHGVTLGVTLGVSVPPSCIPQPACKFRCKYKALADRSATGINPDLPLGATPLGLPISPSVADSIFRRFNVPSQIATHHHGLHASWGGTVEMEEISFWLCVVCGCGLA